MMFGLREQFAYFQCSRCGCLQIAEFPPDIARHYPPTYYTHGGAPALAGVTWTPRQFAKHLRNRFAILRRGAVGGMLHRLWPNDALAACIATHFPGDGLRYTGLTRRSRVLDVGCGAGELLVALQSAGFRRLLGIDVYTVGHGGAARTALIQKRDIDEVTGEWDLVMFHHSFEHMADPRKTLDAVVRLLAPSGVCLIRLPLVSSYAWEHYGVDWVQLDAPRHFFLHTEDSLCRLAHDAGLEISKVVYDSSAFQFVGSELYRRDIPLQSTSPADIRARAAAFTEREVADFAKRAGELNGQRRGDQAAFYMRKRGAAAGSS